MLRHSAWAYVTMVLERMKNTYPLPLYQLGSEALWSTVLLLPKCDENAGKTFSGTESPSLSLLQERDRNKQGSGGVHWYLVGVQGACASKKQLSILLSAPKRWLPSLSPEEPLLSPENSRRERFYYTLKNCSTACPFLFLFSHLSRHPASHSLV